MDKMSRKVLIVVFCIFATLNTIQSFDSESTKYKPFYKSNYHTTTYKPPHGYHRSPPKSHYKPSGYHPHTTTYKPPIGYHTSPPKSHYKPSGHHPKTTKHKPSKSHYHTTTYKPPHGYHTSTPKSHYKPSGYHPHTTTYKPPIGYHPSPPKSHYKPSGHHPKPTKHKPSKSHYHITTYKPPHGYHTSTPKSHYKPSGHHLHTKTYKPSHGYHTSPPKSHYKPSGHHQHTTTYKQSHGYRTSPPKSHYKPSGHHQKTNKHKSRYHPLTQTFFRSFKSAIEQEQESGLDPHGKGKQCVDVSFYTSPTWVQQDRKCCKTVIKKHTYHRSETVCSDVTTFHCDVLPYTKCEKKVYHDEVSTSHWTYEYKPTYACVKNYVEIVHKKKKPVCTKKPKRICNSKWEISPSGEKVWSGNEGCKTIYVDDCKLQEVPEVITVEKPICRDTDQIPFISIIPKKEIKAVYKMECKVLKKVHCETHTTKECATIEYTESEEKPHKTCDGTYAHVPTQHLVHKKKCLLDQETFKQ